MRNEAYLGVARYRRRAGNRLGMRTDDYIRNEKAHEPLVDPALWRRAQSTDSIQRTGLYAAGVAGGLLMCGSCRGRMAVSGTPDRLVYACRRQRTARCGGACCRSIGGVGSIVAMGRSWWAARPPTRPPQAIAECAETVSTVSRVSVPL